MTTGIDDTGGGVPAPDRWPNGARAAVCLSYDDAMPCHPNLVAPALEAHGFRGTFYAPIRDDLIRNTDAWRAMAERGHELGNHTIFHPCRRETPQPDDWIRTWNNLVNFTPDRFRNELVVSNFALRLVDGKTERTYGNTCHDVFIGPPESKERIEPILRELFVAGRGPYTSRPSDPDTLDLACIGTTGGDGKRWDEWKACIDRNLDAGGLLVLTFHGVGRGYERLQVDEEDHRRLLEYLRDRQGDIWTVPVLEAARWIRRRRGEA